MSARSLPDLRTVEVDGRTLAWREAGQGAPLVLVHGIGGHSGSWAHQFTAFASDFRVIAWDAPGYGGSAALSQPQQTAEGYAAALVGLLNAIEAERPHLVGHSLGSIMIAAASRSRRVEPRTLTFLQPVAGSGSLPEAEREAIRQARAADMKRLGPVEFAVQRGRSILSTSTPPAASEEAVEVMKAVPEAGYLAAWDMMCRSDIFPMLESCHPTMVVCGADDPVCPPKLARSIADKIEGAEFECLDNVGHYASIEAPERLNALLRRFFNARA